MTNVTAFFALVSMLLFASSLHAQVQPVQFQLPITIRSDTLSASVLLGISGDGPNPPGTIVDNTIGVDYDTAFGLYQERLAPPPPPPPFALDVRFLTIPGRVSTFPIGLGGGVWEDFRGYFGSTQVDSFRIQIDGQNPNENFGATISWPSNLNQFGTAWTIKPLSGSAFAQTDMLTSDSVNYTPQFGPVNVLIIKTGAFVPPAGPTFVLNTSFLDFDTVGVGSSATLTVTVTNTGVSNPLSISGVSSLADYTVIPNPPEPFPIQVAPLSSHDFDVTFTPPSAGTFAGDIVFVHNAASSPDTLEVTGEGVQSVFQVSPSSIDFGDVSVGTVEVESLMVSNTGNISLRVISASSSNPRFAVSPDSAEILPQASVLFSVSFSPLDTGMQTSVIEFVHSSSSSPDTVSAIGRGVAAIYAVNQMEIDFGQVPVGSTRQDSFVVSNQGNIPLTLVSIITSDPRFSVNPSSGNVGVGGSFTVNVSFAPDSIRIFDEWVVLTHNGASSPDSVRVRGDVITEVDEYGEGIPTEFTLYQNFPNPFNPSTEIRYALPKESTVTLRIFNLLGQEIAMLVNETKPAGYHSTLWTPAMLASGMYIYRLEAKPIDGGGAFLQVKKLLLVK